MENAKQPIIFQIIDDALSNIEKKNKQLAGALPNNYYSNLVLDKTKFASLLDEINKLDTVKDAENDLIGRVYEYFLGKFAIAEGKGKGEYYTPKSVVNLIAELIEPYVTSRPTTTSRNTATLPPSTRLSRKVGVSYPANTSSSATVMSR